MADFFAADVGRDIVALGGLGTITAYVDPSTVTVQIKAAFPSTAFDSGDWTILGSPNTSCAPSAKDPVGATITLTLDAAGWRAEDVGKYVRINGGLCKITSLDGVSPTTIANAIIIYELASAVSAQSLAWTLEGSVWSARYGYPRCGTLHEQRLWLAGSPAFPHTVWGSTIGEYLDFTLGTLDDEALAYIVASGELNPIRHLANASGMIALTSGGEYSIRGGQEKAITPTNIQIRDQSNYGCGAVAPVRVGNEIFFVQRAGRKVRALSPNQYTADQYVAPDMAVLSEHITESGVVDMAFQSEPETLLYAARADGQLATLTADRDQEVFAWARQVTQGNFESVDVVPTADGYRVFAVIARTKGGVTTRYIELFDANLHTDSGITGHSDAGEATWAGLDHLEGRTVRVKGDGVVLTDQVVSGGQVTLERTANDVEFGLDYITTVKTLTPEFNGPVGSTQGSNLSIHEVTVRLLETTGCKINLQEVAFRKYGEEVLDKPPPLHTGDKKAGNLGWGDGVAQTLIQQTQPYPFHLLAVITLLTANEG